MSLIPMAFSASLLFLAGCTSLPPLRGPFERPLIIGHRGAPGYVPEHTIRSYTLALDGGADYIEPDVVFSQDGTLVIRHENEISQTTNAAQIYPDRKATKMIDGQKITGWFSEDFTLAELKKLRVKERLDFRSHKEDGLYQIVTFEEYLQFVRTQEKIRGRRIGIVPEIKHSTYFHQLGFDPEARLVELLMKYNFNDKHQPVIIQSFEVENLKRLREMTPVELMQLVDDPPGTMTSAAGLKEISHYADWVSPEKSSIYPRDREGRIHAASPLVREAHAVGLKVIPYTFRKEPAYLPTSMTPEQEYAAYFAAGIDGLFTDFSDLAVKARQDFLKNKAK